MVAKEIRSDTNNNSSLEIVKVAKINSFSVSPVVKPIMDTKRRELGVRTLIHPKSTYAKHHANPSFNPSMLKIA